MIVLKPNILTLCQLIVTSSVKPKIIESMVWHIELARVATYGYASEIFALRK
jgi:hypothetical protein